jgi:hypothetical protein
MGQYLKPMLERAQATSAVAQKGKRQREAAELASPDRGGGPPKVVEGHLRALGTLCFKQSPQRNRGRRGIVSGGYAPNSMRHPQLVHLQEGTRLKLT